MHYEGDKKRVLLFEATCLGLASTTYVPELRDQICDFLSAQIWRRSGHTVHACVDGTEVAPRSDKHACMNREMQAPSTCTTPDNCLLCSKMPYFMPLISNKGIALKDEMAPVGEMCQ